MMVFLWWQETLSWVFKSPDIKSCSIYLLSLKGTVHASVMKEAYIGVSDRVVSIADLAVSFGTNAFCKQVLINFLLIF